MQIKAEIHSNIQSKVVELLSGDNVRFEALVALVKTDDGKIQPLIITAKEAKAAMIFAEELYDLADKHLNFVKINQTGELPKDAKN